MTPPRLNEVQCPGCQRTSWVIDSDDQGMDDIHLPYDQRSYACPHCGKNGRGWTLLQQSPIAFLLQPSDRDPMTQAEFDHWVNILRTNFPDASILTGLGTTFFPRLPEEAEALKEAEARAYPVIEMKDQDGARRALPEPRTAGEWFEIMKAGDFLVFSRRDGGMLRVDRGEATHSAHCRDAAGASLALVDGVDERTARQSIGYYLAGDVGGCIRTLERITPSATRRFFRRLFEFRGVDLVGHIPPPRTAVRRSAKPSAGVRLTTDACQGPFLPLFVQEGTNYLPLLNLPPEAAPAILFIADVVRGTSDYRPRVLALLNDPGWRLHLVGAIAVLLSDDRAAYSDALWSALDRGSWVAPQLAVVLSRCDPQFVVNAKERIVAGCPVTPVDYGLTEHESYVVMGPDGSFERSAKAIGALLEILNTISAEAEWADRVSRDPGLQRFLPYSVKHATHWAGELEKRFSELALPLPTVSH
jgi:hypothetical protein